MKKLTGIIVIAILICGASSVASFYTGYKMSIEDTRDHGLKAYYTGMKYGDQYKWKLCNHNVKSCVDVWYETSKQESNENYEKEVYYMDVYFKKDVELLFEYYELAEKLKLSRYLRR